MGLMALRAPADLRWPALDPRYARSRLPAGQRRGDVWGVRHVGNSPDGRARLRRGLRGDVLTRVGMALGWLRWFLQIVLVFVMFFHTAMTVLNKIGRASGRARVERDASHRAG